MVSLETTWKALSNDFLHSQVSLSKALSSNSASNPPHPNPGRREKIKLQIYFHTSLSCLKGFMKALKAFIKPFEAPQRSVRVSRRGNIDRI